MGGKRISLELKPGHFVEFGIPHLHNLILELGKEEVDDLVLLDGERVEVDLLHALDLASLDETAELGDGLPLLLIGLASTASTTASSTATAAVTATITTTGCESAAAAGGTGSSISHFLRLCRWCREKGVAVVDWPRYSKVGGRRFFQGGGAFCCEIRNWCAQVPKWATLKFR